MQKDWNELSYEYSLDNALQHDGKANEGAILGRLFAEGLEKSQIKDVIGIIKSNIKKVNSMNLDSQKKEFEKYKNKFD